VDWNYAPGCIGSLPYETPEEAVDLILSKIVEVPFWPQLPRRGYQENMYVQFSAGLPGIKIDEAKARATVDLTSYDPEETYMRILSDDVGSFAMDKGMFPGFHEFMSRDLPKSALAVKGQVTGPISLGMQTLDSSTGKPALYDETYSEILRRSLNMIARWQERELKRKHERTIMFLDEPYLSLLGTPFASISPEDAVKWIGETVAGLDSVKGAHCCSNADWPLLMSMDLDLISFDAYEHGHTMALYPEETDRFLKRGGILAWGIVPTSAEAMSRETPASLADRVEGHINSLESKGVDGRRLRSQAMLTPSCGLGILEVGTAEAAIDMLIATSEELRSR